jgi:hypothetical protein
MVNLREACEAIKQDIENSPGWLKNIYEQNRRIREFIELRNSGKLDYCGYLKEENSNDRRN